VLIMALRRTGAIKGWPIELHGPRPFDFRGGVIMAERTLAPVHSSPRPVDSAMANERDPGLLPSPHRGGRPSGRPFQFQHAPRLG
jgi:hypothetical protein